MQKTRNYNPLFSSSPFTPVSWLASSCTGTNHPIQAVHPPTPSHALTHPLHHTSKVINWGQSVFESVCLARLHIGALSHTLAAVQLLSRNWPCRRQVNTPARSAPATTGRHLQLPSTAWQHDSLNRDCHDIATTAIRITICWGHFCSYTNPINSALSPDDEQQEHIVTVCDYSLICVTMCHTGHWKSPAEFTQNNRFSTNCPGWDTSVTGKQLNSLIQPVVINLFTCGTGQLSCSIKHCHQLPGVCLQYPSCVTWSL